LIIDELIRFEDLFDRLAAYCLICIYS